MSKNNDNWEPCPRCGSNKVESRGGCFFAVVGIALIGVSFWLLIIPPIGIAGIVIGFGLLLFSPFAKNSLMCKDCKNTWKYPAENNEYRDKSKQDNVEN